MSKVDLLLKESGAFLVRKRKHEIWKLPNGKIFVRAQSPSDVKNEDNNLSDLRRALGISNLGNRDGSRRERKHKPGRDEVIKFNRNINNSLAEQIGGNGLAEKALRSKVDALENKLRQKTEYQTEVVDVLKRQNALLQEDISENCFICNLKFQIKSWKDAVLNRIIKQ